MQARRLYTLNWLRIIPDVSYAAVRLLPEDDPSSDAPLDLSFAVLRSVSPIHIEYLQNMGVTASMSMSLVRNGTLVGLIACHHYAGPHYVSFVTRETVEYLGQVLSWHLATLDAQDAAERELVTQRSKAQLISAIATAATIPQGLSDPALLELTGATGASIVYEDAGAHGRSGAERTPGPRIGSRPGGADRENACSRPITSPRSFRTPKPGTTSRPACWRSTSPAISVNT